MKSSTATLRVAADLKYLAAIRHFFEQTAAALRADKEAMLDLMQALDECACNIIVHGYQDGLGEIRVEVWCEGERLLVRLSDQAPPFDPTQAPTPDTTLPLDMRPMGGMGIHLSRHLTDAMIYRRTGNGGNELTLIKTAIPPQTSEEANHAGDR